MMIGATKELRSSSEDVELGSDANLDGETLTLPLLHLEAQGGRYKCTGPKCKSTSGSPRYCLSVITTDPVPSSANEELPTVELGFLWSKVCWLIPLLLQRLVVAISFQQGANLTSVSVSLQDVYKGPVDSVVRAVNMAPLPPQPDVQSAHEVQPLVATTAEKPGTSAQHGHGATPSGAAGTSDHSMDPKRQTFSEPAKLKALTIDHARMKEIQGPLLPAISKLL